MTIRPRTKVARRRAIFSLATERGCSYAVAAHIIDCMSIEKRSRFLNKFRPSDEEWKRIQDTESP